MKFFYTFAFVGLTFLQARAQNIFPATGAVGIGTSSPNSGVALHIVTTGSDLNAGNSPTIKGALTIQGNTGGRLTTNGAQLEFAIPANADGTNIYGQGRIIVVAGNTTTSNAAGKMVLGTRRSFNKMGTGNQWYYGDDITIDGTGKVGIGTLTPQEALSVNGNVRAKQVKVEATNWPDYVFRQGYSLPSLSEVKAYIDQNQHLPEIPSAENYR
jgi:ethanolamine utilization microcompartment shell protein EutS